jgi:hypothetical protein
MQEEGNVPKIGTELDIIVNPVTSEVFCSVEKNVVGALKNCSCFKAQNVKMVTLFLLYFIKYIPVNVV